MDTATLMQIGWGMLGGGLATFVGYGILALKLFRLQMAFGALREALLSLRNRAANESRQVKKNEMEQFLRDSAVHKNERFANDPF